MEKEIIIKADSLLARNETDFLFTAVDNETVLMNIHNSSYFGLDDVSTDIWKILDTRKSLKSLLVELTQLYEVELKQCEEDTEQFIKAMIYHNLLKLT